jgi:hypothetical protein
MKTLISTMILLLSLTQASQRPASVARPSTRPQALPQSRQQQSVSTTPVPQQQVLATESAVLADLQAASSPAAGGGLGVEGLWGQACQTVLVVPTPELLGSSAETNSTDNNQSPSVVNGTEAAPEGASRVAQITEDMTVMCRILDKVAAPTQTSRYAVRINGMTRMFGNEESRTQGLYLAGYGALFFVPVDLPLRPPQQEQPQPQGEPTADPVWSQTVEELRGSPADGQRTAAPTQAYDAQKVENLKATLIKSLRHAANLRLASAQDLITLVVGPQDARVRLYATSPSNVATTTGRARGRSSTLRSEVGSVGRAPQDLSSVLILRVSKADVDAFAKGEIPAGAFAEKVQTLWSWANRGSVEPPTPVRSSIYRPR